jgi:hypothetical protein
MVKITSLEIQGYKNQLVPNTYYQQNIPSSSLAIVLPGYGYTTGMPLLYYSTRLLLQQGADVLSVDYAYNKQPAYKNCTEDERLLWLMGDVHAACKKILATGEYDKLMVVGKSLGTVATGSMLINPDLDLDLFSSACLVWLTPVLDMTVVRQGISTTMSRSFVAIGTADSYYDAAFINNISEQAPEQVFVVEEGDHSLEIKDDLSLSVSELHRFIDSLKNFFQVDET